MSIFNSVLVKKPGRSLFNLRHERKFSGDWSYLYPILCLEAVPGDTFKISTEVLVRTAPLIAPIMHRVSVKLNYFFVPNRLIWNEWQDFITGISQTATYNPASTDQSSYFVTKVPPFYELSNSTSSAYQAFFKDGQLADFLGFPTMRPSESMSGSVNVQVLPFRAYQQIYNDWYRNQNVEAENVFSKASGKITSNLNQLFMLRRRMWEKDYFTSALPFAQRGDAVPIPIAQLSFNPEGRTILRDDQGGSVNIVTENTMVADYYSEKPSAQRYTGINVADEEEVKIDNTENLKITMGSINDLRSATKLQKWLEVNARVGGRYIEQILGHFGIHSSDARLQRAEYLGGWSSPIIVSDVEQNSASGGTATSTTSGTTPQGNLAGKGTSYGQSTPIKCFCEEHGFVIGLLSIMPKTSYQDGLPRMFQRNYKEDYYFPEFANLGEQEINKAEVSFKLSDSTKRSFDRFGFQERYCEYKYVPSTVHGEFKNALQFWHLGRSFPDNPALNKTFCTCEPRTNIFAVSDSANHFYVNLINNVTALRPMPKQAIPSL